MHHDHQAIAAMYREPPLFESTHSALAFAFNFSDGQYAEGTLARLIGGHIGTGKGLVALDGAAQAGMILHEVDALAFPAAHILTARFAPHALRCECKRSCCYGWKPAPLWNGTTNRLAELAERELAGRSSNSRLRVAIVRRFFGENATMSKLAEGAGVNRNTASEQAGLIIGWLKREQEKAFQAIDGMLHAKGIVGAV